MTDVGEFKFVDPDEFEDYDDVDSTTVTENERQEPSEDTEGC